MTPSRVIIFYIHVLNSDGLLFQSNIVNSTKGREKKPSKTGWLSLIFTIKFNYNLTHNSSIFGEFSRFVIWNCTVINSYRSLN